MKIGLVRHFPVIHPYNTRQWMTSSEYADWLNAYDVSEVRCLDLTLSPNEWGVCYSSDISRALATARSIYPGEIQVTPLLREIHVNPVFSSNLRLPFRTWDALSHLAWFISHPSQAEGRQKVMERLQAFLSDAVIPPGGHVNGQGNILVVSHGGLMWYLRTELLRLGFKGDSFTRAENGRLYIFERS